MSRSFESTNLHRSHVHLGTISKWGMWKSCVGCGADIDGRAGASCEFLVSGNEVGVEVSFENVADPKALLFRRLQIDIDITLRVDDRSFAVGADHVGRVRQTAQVELFEIHSNHPTLTTSPPSGFLANENSARIAVPLPTLEFLPCPA